MGKRGSAGRAIGQTAAGGNLIPEGYNLGQLQQFSPEQINLFRSLFSHTAPESYLSRLSQGEPGMFEQIEAPALKQFQQLQGQLGSRFAGMGMGALKSSGFRNIANQQTMDFAQQLAAQRMGLQRQALQDLMGMSQMLMGQRPTEQFLTPREKSFMENFALGMAPGVGESLGRFPMFLMGR